MVKSIQSFFSTEKRQSFLIYAWFFFLCGLSYGILIPKLGFYWDDLPILFQYKTFGAGGFPAFLASDRPYSAWIFMLTTSLFHYNPLGYHLLAFGLRLASVILFYQIFLTVWPEKTQSAAVASGIFAIYPGFHQQPIALIYCHHFSVLNFFLLSVWLMLRNAQQEKFNWYWGVLSWLLTFGMFSIENFATLEMIRPVLLGFVLFPKFSTVKDTLKAVLKIWLPYLLIFFAFMVWRVLIFQFPTYEPDLLEGYASSPASTLTALLSRIPKDFYTATIGAWVKSFQLPQISHFGTAATYLFWILVDVSLLVSWFLLGMLNPNQNSPAGNPRKYRVEWVLTAFVLFFLAGSIVWVLEMPFEIEFAWDRMTLAFMPGIALLAAWLYSLQHKTKIFANILVCTLISMAVGAHFENGMSYKRDWENMQDLFWQLSWRMPELEKGTTVLGSDFGINYYSDNALTAPLNLLYSPDNHSTDLDYVFYYSEVRVGTHLPSLDKNLPIRQRYRSFLFNGSTNQIVAIKYNPPACLQVMDRVYANSITLPNLSEMQTAELKFTDQALIRSEPVHQPLAEIFSSQPETGWCYYFEKADLARQLGNYEEAVSLGEEAIQKGFAPRAASEWLPFLESNIRLENWERTEYIADEIVHSTGNYRDGLCNTLKRLSKDTEIANSDKLVEYMQGYNCP